MIFGWFDAKDAEEFGAHLARFFMERVPLEPSNKRRNSVAKKKEVLEKMFLQVAQFRQARKLNIYKKAKLGNAFKWELREAGYDAEFTDDLTKLLMQQL